MKTAQIGVILLDTRVADARELPCCPPMHPARRWRGNLQRSLVSPR
jgi:hypothetical protein